MRSNRVCKLLKSEKRQRKENHAKDFPLSVDYSTIELFISLSFKMKINFKFLYKNGFLISKRLIPINAFRYH